MKILRTLLVTIIFIMEIPVKLAILLYCLIDSIVRTIKGEFTFGEYWGYIFYGFMMGFEWVKYFVRTGKINYEDEDEEL